MEQNWVDDAVAAKAASVLQAYVSCEPGAGRVAQPSVPAEAMAPVVGVAGP